MLYMIYGMHNVKKHFGGIFKCLCLDELERRLSSDEVLSYDKKYLGFVNEGYQDL